MNITTPLPAINIFYYNVEVVSNETKIILEWTIGSEKRSQILEVNAIMRVRNELKTSVPQPPGVMFKAYRFDDKSQLIINNDETDVEVMPSSSREEFTILEVTATKGKCLKLFEDNLSFFACTTESISCFLVALSV